MKIRKFVKKWIAYLKAFIKKVRGIEFPRIGMRIIKTILAVYLCFVIEYLIGTNDSINAPITAIICMQRDMKNSIEAGVTRVFGTIMGGLLGLVILLLFYRLHVGANSLFYYLIVTLCLLPVIYSTLLLKKPEAASITCILFLTIVLGDFSETSPFLFTAKRMFDTLTGIGVAFFINWLPILDYQAPLSLNKKQDEEDED